TYTVCSFFFFQAEDGIRDRNVTGVQTCALPILFSVFGSLALVLTPRHHRALLPYVAGVVSLVAAFFISVMLFGQANPFQRLPYTPLDGNGLNPQLQNPGMVFHPPMLYLGYISITIPF